MGILEVFKKIKFKAVTIGTSGISLDLEIPQEEKLKLTPKHLREIYKIHYTLSRFYSLYSNKQITAFDEDELTLSMLDEAFKTYKKLADELLSSEYFLLLNAKQRTDIRDIFDTVNFWDTYLEASVDNEVEAAEVSSIVEELLNLFENTSKVIEDLEKQLESK